MRVSVLVVAGAVLAAAALLAVARPQLDQGDGSEMIDFSEEAYHSPAAVRAAFAAEGVRLRVASRFNGFVTLSNEPRPLTADALQVNLAPRSGKGSWGPRLEPYDERFGNVLVTYGGTDRRLLANVEAAVAALR